MAHHSNNANQLQDDDNTTENIRSQAHIINTALSFINSMALKCAVELGIAEALHRNNGGPLTLSQLATELKIPAERESYLARLMRKLENVGVFEKHHSGNGDVGYSLTPSSKRLSNRAGPNVRLVTCPAMVAGWQHLSSWIRGEHGEAPTPFHVANGVGIWEYAGRTPEFNELFNKSMIKDADLVVTEVVAKCGPVFDGVQSLVDVGGGNGTISRAIAECYRHLHCIVFDLPHVVRGQPAAERVEYVGGDMFQSVPRADVALLKHILHDYNDEDCVKILKQCKKSIASKENDGKVIILDMVLNLMKDQEFKLIENQLFYDLEMMVVVGGKERDESEWKEIFISAGFTSYKITSIINFFCLIEVFL